MWDKANPTKNKGNKINLTKSQGKCNARVHCTGETGKMTKFFAMQSGIWALVIDIVQTGSHDLLFGDHPKETAWFSVSSDSDFAYIHI